jgi:regulator of protease activity HflC (stomatin/prohibitin superfamily)
MSSLIASLIAPLVIIFLLSGIRIAKEWERGVVLFLGRFKAVKGPGIFYVIPILESARIVDTRISTVAIETQETITRDNVSIKVNAVVWFRVSDAKSAVITIQNYSQAVYQFTATNLRNMIGVHSLDEVLKERQRINGDMIGVLNETINAWGIDIQKVEIKDIEIPEAMQRAMAMEAEAIREKRARIIKASAEFEASEQLAAASKVIIENPVALELRRLQMITEVGAEQNTTTIVMMPSDFISLAKEARELIENRNKDKRTSDRDKAEENENVKNAK